MATPDAGTDGSGWSELEVGIRPAPGEDGRDAEDRGLIHGGVAWRGAETPARWGVHAPRADDHRPEEVAACELCGLVARHPVPPVCPACGGGFG